MATKEKDSATPNSGMVDISTLPIEEPEDGVFMAYANVVNMDWTLVDVHLRFGELMQVPDDNSPSWDNQHGIVLERAAITIPWQQAKYLRNLLDGLVKSYESINGELIQVKLPPAP